MAVEHQWADLAVPCRGPDSQLTRLVAVADGDIGDPFASTVTRSGSDRAVGRW